MKKVLVIGGSGFIGENITETIENKYDVISVGSSDYNLIYHEQANKMFKDTNPDIAIYVAGRSGGIKSNRDFPVEYLRENGLLALNVWHYANIHNVKKLIAICPGCLYGRNTPNPMKESDFFNGGAPDEAPSFGAASKRLSILASQAYRQEYGLNSCVLIPCNLFGKYDHFDENNSHVIPAMLLKFHKAKKEGQKSITLWGSGKAIRDFAVCSDFAKTIPFFIENDIHFPAEIPCLERVINLSTGKGTTIKELAEKVSNVVGFDGEIVWDTTKPEGPLEKIFCNERMKSLGLSFDTPFEDALKESYEWFQQQ